MVRKSDEALEKLHAEGNYKALWTKALPLTKYAISTLIRTGKITKEHSTDDFYQDCCLAAGEAVRRWDPKRASFSRWIFIKVRDAVRASYRGRAGRSDAYFDEERTACDRLSGVEALERRGEQTQIRRALGNLPPQYQEVIERRHGIGRPVETIAQIARSKKVVRRSVELMLMRAERELESVLTR